MCPSECFPSFVGRALKLMDLEIYIHEQEDTDNIYQVLEAEGTKSPFPSLRRFRCLMCGTMLQINLSFLDVKILRWMPNITTSELLRHTNTSDPSSLRQGLATAHHIKKIRKFCPDLETIRLEICLLDPYWKLPFDIIDELARFGKLLNIHLYVNCNRSWTGNPRMSVTRHWMLGRRVRQLRRRLGLLWVRPFWIRTNSFTTGERFRDPYETEFTIENRNSWFGAVTTVHRVVENPAHHPSKLDESRLDDLKVMKYKLILVIPVCRHDHIVQEIERRKRRDARVVETDEPHTLYDAWMQQDDCVHTGSIQAA